MDVAIKALLRDPVIGLPILCAILAVASLIAGSLRAWQNGTFHWPAWDAWSKDLSSVLLITLVLFLSKVAALFIPESGVEVGGLDLGPILSVAGPGVFFAAGAAKAATFMVSKVASIKDSLEPPDPVALNAKIDRADALGDPIPTA